MLHRRRRQRFDLRLAQVALVLAAFSLPCKLALADAPRALPAGKLPDDRRLAPLKDLDGYFPFTPSKSPAEWEKRAEFLRRQMLVSLGLWPTPTKTPVNAVVHGRVERDDYTVDRVYLESYPGHFVTGSLYLPKNRSGKLPAVLCPHGHWNNGRFVDMGSEQIKRDIVAGAERFDPSGRYPLQARCVQLARMGCIVFHYDMVGYADSQQIPQSVSHGFAKQRPQLDQPESWGFFGVQAELRGQSIMGLQTWNSIRALDWISELPDVDSSRIGVTGASGGGTQTFLLAALDPRVTVAFPAVMVSTAMQGGCTCENASLLRIDTGNIEFAALFAPRPMGMTGADDWTKEIATKGLPELKRHYAMLGAADNVAAFPFLHFPHNYNSVSRHAMYQWMNKHLKLGVPGLAIEQDFKPLSIAEMTVWDDEHPKPPSGEDYERSLTKTIAGDAEKQLAALVPNDRAGLVKYRQVVGGGVAGIIGRALPGADAIHY
jgi:dienelactone hydrolase